MIVKCSRCDARYRFDESRMTSDSATLRCRKCQAAIAVCLPATSPAEADGTARTPPASSPVAFPQAAKAVMPVAAVPPAAGEAPRPSRSASPAAGRTALLADDAREFRDFVQSELRAAGYEVSVTDNGEEALLLTGSHRFDLILLNVYLHRLLGISVCEQIKADPALQSMPVILMGALVGPERPMGPRSRYGSDDFISTSIGREELAARIARFSQGEFGPRTPASTTTPSPAPPVAAKEPPGREPAPTGDEAEIRRLARIMISDIQIYHPEKFSRALREGTFFEAFSDELGRGKEMIDQRFGRLANRIQILAAGLRDSLESYRNGGSPRLSVGG